MTTEAVKATLSQRLTAESVVMGYVEEISPETKNIILDHICFDLDASVEHIKKNMPMIMAKYWENENKAMEKLLNK